MLMAARGEMEAAVTEANAGEIGTALEPLLTFTQLVRWGGAPEAAREGARLLQRLAPNSFEALVAEGELACAERRWAAAEEAYRQALSVNPESLDGRSWLGIVVRQRGRFLEAWRTWNQVLRLEPTNRWALGYLLGELSWLRLLMPNTLSLLLGGIALIPTIQGRPRNDWMPWATFAGPVVVSFLTAILYHLCALLIAPTSRSAWKKYGADARSSITLFFSFAVPVLLSLHALQAWAELALHPAFLPARWPGAATITILAAYTGRVVFSWREPEKANPPQDPTYRA